MSGEAREQGRPATLGGRVRGLRRSLGLTQGELADGRFSKEYVSQIERGATQPTAETLEWLAARLGTDRAYLEHGLSGADLALLEEAIRAGERLVEGHRYAEALERFEWVHERLHSAAGDLLAFRLAKGEAWAHLREGNVKGAMAALERGASLAVSSGFSDGDRAELVFMVGVARYTESRIDDAIVLLGEALELAERSDTPSDHLRSDILHWRSRCHRRNRDWVAAQEDSELALEVAEAAADPRRTADALFQASLVAQRQGRWVLARSYAERSRALFDELGDRATVARLLNNLAGLDHLLGDSSTAAALLSEAFGSFVDLGLEVDAGYVCSSLAAVRLDRGEPELAEAQARRALELLGDRADHAQEVGMAKVTLGRALAAQGRLDEAGSWIAAGDEDFDAARSLGHRSHAWLAEGDVLNERGDHAAAARAYRRAALALLEPDAARIGA